MYRIISIIFLGIGFLFFTWRCKKNEISSNTNQDLEIILKQKEQSNLRDWNDFFINEKEVQFSFSNLEDRFLSISALLINDFNDYIILDRSQTALYHLDSTGKSVKFIGKKGRGPGEFEFISSLVLNAQNDLLIYDESGRRIVQFKAPYYTYDSLLYLKNGPSLPIILISPDGNFITYSQYREKILEKYNNEGILIKQTFKPDDEMLRIFLERFELGGITMGHNKNGFYMIHPAKYEFYYYDFNLNLKRTYKSKNVTEFRPRIDKFPVDLTPYAFTDKHMQWWDRYLHPVKVLDLNNNIVGVQLTKTEGKNYTVKNYLNLHNTDGTTYVEGLEVPYSAKILTFHNGHIFLGVRAKMGHGDEVIPPKLYRYKFKMDVL